ncbi:MAG: hypothetical protein Q9226_007404, partial [Calogaya cf. arnoldii]
DLSSLAAIVIILSLAIDPFAQQLARPEVQSFVASLEAEANVQWMYSGHSMRATQAMVNLAFFGAKPRETPYVCPSGKCSWSPYQTLAVCHECVDISDLAKADDWCNGYSENCSVSLPSLPHNLSVDIKIVEPVWRTTTLRATGKGALRRIHNPGLSIVNYTQLTYLRPFPPKAIECTLRWCINRYSAQLESGVFTETYLDSWWSPADPQALNLDDRGVFFRITPQSREGNVTLPNEHDNHVSYNTSHFSSEFPASNVSGAFEPRYVHNLSHHGLSRSLTSSLDITGSSASGRTYPGFGDPDIGGYLAELYDNSFDTNPVHDIFSNIAAGLTQWLRQDEQAQDNAAVDFQAQSETYYLAGSRFAVGTAFENRSIIRIRWGWLVLPVGVVAMTAVVSLSALLRSSREDMPVWGSSTMALMLRGPFSEAPESLPGRNSTDRFQRLARQTEVEFEKDIDHSWRLVQTRTFTEEQNETSISAFSRASVWIVLFLNLTLTEIESLKNSRTIATFGPPLQPSRLEPASTPLLRILLQSFINDLPGFRNVNPQFWTDSIYHLATALDDANLSESYDKGSVGIRRTLSTASASIIESVARGRLGGYPKQALKGDSKYDKANSDDIARAWDEFLQRIIYGDLLDKMFVKAAETDKLSDHEPVVQAAHQYALI